MKKQIALILLLTMLCTLMCPAAFAATQEDPNSNTTEVSEETSTESEKTPAESEETSTESKETSAKPEETPVVSEETTAVFGISKEDFLARCQELAELAENGKKKLALALYDSLKEELTEMMDQISLSQEVSAAAITDYATCRAAFLTVAHAMTEGRLRKNLKAYISEEEFDYLEQYTALTAKQNELSEKEISLREEYLTILSDAAKKASATLNGKTYTYEQLQKAEEPQAGIPEGLTEEQWSELLNQCCNQIADSCADAFIQVITARREIAKEMGATSYDQLLDEEKGCKATPEEMKTFYQMVKEFASDPRFSGSIIRGQNRDITTEEFLNEFTSIVEDASPLAAAALQDLKDTGSIVIKKAQSEPDSGVSTMIYLHFGYQQGLLNPNIGKTDIDFQILAMLLGIYTGLYASDGIESFQMSGYVKSHTAICGDCLQALLTASYDSVLSDTDAAILANNTVTSLKNQLIRHSMLSEWEQYLYSDAPLTKEGLIEKYNSLLEAYGMKGTGYDGMLNTEIMISPMPLKTSLRTTALSSFYALQVFNKAMKNPDKATEMFEEFCYDMDDEDCEETLTDAGFVYFTDEDGVRKTLEKAAENYEVLHEYATVMSDMRDDGQELELGGNLPETMKTLKKVKPLVEQLPEFLAELQEAAQPGV